MPITRKNNRNWMFWLTLFVLFCTAVYALRSVLLPFVEHGLLVELLDIVEREEWVDHYALRIPVLRRTDNGAELNWPFEAEQVASFLRG